MADINKGDLVRVIRTSSPWFSNTYKVAFIGETSQKVWLEVPDSKFGLVPFGKQDLEVVFPI